MTNIGVTSILSSTLSLDGSGNTMLVQKATVAVTEKLVGAWLYCSADSRGAAAFRIAVYDDDATHTYPVNVIAESAERELNAGDTWAWRYVAVAAEPTLTAGDIIFFGVHNEIDTLNIRYSTAGGVNYEQGDTYSDGAEDPWSPAGGGGPGTRQYSCYLVTAPLNSAPNAPTLTWPTGGTTINYDEANTFTGEFSDPDSGDTMSALNIRYRVVGDPVWTELGWTAATEFSHEFAASTFAAEDYEWEGATKDELGEAGPWSSPSYFTGAAAAVAPVIDTPAVDEVITTTSYQVTWTVTNQMRYQLRRLSDNGGSPGTTVYETTKIYTSPAGRSYTLHFTANGRVEHIQLRVEYGGIWSEWADASVRVSIQWPPPATPYCVCRSDASKFAFHISAIHPSIGDVDHMDVYRSEAGAAAIRIAADLDPDDELDDYVLGSDVIYTYTIRAFDATGAWTDSTLTLETTHALYDVTDYGAVGDGVTDDTAAIQAAINAAYAAGGGVVWFGADDSVTYLVGSTLSMKTDVALAGCGPTLYMAPVVGGDRLLEAISADRFSVWGLALESLHAAPTFSEIVGLWIESCADPAIHGLKTTDMEYAMRLRPGTTDVVVTELDSNNDVETVTASGVVGGTFTNIVIDALTDDTNMPTNNPLYIAQNNEDLSWTNLSITGGGTNGVALHLYHEGSYPTDNSTGLTFTNVTLTNVGRICLVCGHDDVTIDTITGTQRKASADAAVMFDGCNGFTMTDFDLAGGEALVGAYDSLNYDVEGIVLEDGYYHQTEDVFNAAKFSSLTLTNVVQVFDYPTFVGIENAWGVASPVTVNVPADVEDGDQLIAAVLCVASASPDIGTPAGWDLVAKTTSTYRAYAIFKRTANSEPASYDFTMSGTSVNQTGALIGAWRGPIGETVSVDQYSNTPYTTTDTTVRAAGVTTTGADERGIIIAFWRSSSLVTEPSEYDDHLYDYDATIDWFVYVADKLYLTAGATGDVDVIVNDSIYRKHAFLVTLKSS